MKRDERQRFLSNLNAQGSNGNDSHAIFSHISVAGANNDSKQGGRSTFAGIDPFSELQQAGCRVVYVACP